MIKVKYSFLENITFGTLLFFLFITPSFGDFKMNCEKLIQTALDHKELASYYHTTKHPERIPLKILCLNTDCRSFKLSKFNKPVEILDSLPHDENVITISSFSYKENFASFILTYPIEGIRAKFSFEINDDKSIKKTSVSLFEE